MNARPSGKHPSVKRGPLVDRARSRSEVLDNHEQHDAGLAHEERRDRVRSLLARSRRLVTSHREVSEDVMGTWTSTDVR